jgi:hypothetical protein
MPTTGIKAVEDMATSDGKNVYNSRLNLKAYPMILLGLHTGRDFKEDEEQEEYYSQDEDDAAEA